MQHLSNNTDTDESWVTSGDYMKKLPVSYSPDVSLYMLYTSFYNWNRSHVAEKQRILSTHPLLAECWSGIADAVPAFIQQLVNI